ncbi:MAG: aminopeptidase, partial [Gallicola sp.]|nr:aminopeptidase [Gallicola sp.]
RGATLIAIDSENPELLKDVDPERIKLASRTRLNATKHLMKYTMNDIVSWIVVAVPSVEWAEKVYPKLESQTAVDKLWDDIFKFVRVEEGDSIHAWEEHLSTMARHADVLNEKQFVGLKYKSDNGTDLYVAMPKNHIWHAANAKNSYGDRFIPNMPTEEVFTAHKFGTHGRLISTMPLSHNGKLIKDIDLTFEDGKVIKYSASENEDALRDMLEMDEGALHLGEVALVPHDSPISNSNTIFFNTLFDENASCHFALGKAYPTSVIGGADLADDELESAGLNDSMIHVDFMVGSESLSIIGVEEDGMEFVIFKDGNFAF